MAQAIETVGHGHEHGHSHGHPPGEFGSHGQGHELDHQEHGHGPVYQHHHFDDMEQQREATALGMWTFLITEVMMFGVLMFAYSLYRYKYGNEWLAGSHSLNFTLGFFNTLVLLCSSLTMAMGVHAAQMRDIKRLRMFLAITWVLGLSFLVIKGFEWTADYHEGLIPSLNWDPRPHLHGEIGEKFLGDKLNLQGYQMYFVLYFCMTGLHAIHMVIGLGLVGYFWWLAGRGMFTNGNDQPIEIMGLYWHFVDIVWVFLFPLLYLIGGGHIATVFNTLTGRGG